MLGAQRSPPHCSSGSPLLEPMPGQASSAASSAPGRQRLGLGARRLSRLGSSGPPARLNLHSASLSKAQSRGFLEVLGGAVQMLAGGGQGLGVGSNTNQRLGPGRSGSPPPNTPPPQHSVVQGPDGSSKAGSGWAGAVSQPCTQQSWALRGCRSKKGSACSRATVAGSALAATHPSCFCPCGGRPWWSRGWWQRGAVLALAPLRAAGCWRWEVLCPSRAQLAQTLKRCRGAVGRSGEGKGGDSR